MPERSFYFRGKQFPMCARCTGITAGYVFELAMWWIYRPPVWLAALIVLPMVVDGGLQRYRGVLSTNLRRVLTGFLYGCGAMGLVLHFAAWTFGF